MKLSIDEVKKAAKLANLNLTEKEELEYSNQLSQILDYVDTIEKVDTSGIEPTFNVSGKETVLAPDRPSESLTQKEVLQNAPNSKNNYFITKGVFEEK